MAVDVGDLEPWLRVLGPPEIRGSSVVAVRGRRQHGLLALLCSELGRRVSTFRLEDELWDGQVVSEAAVRVTVNRLRNRFVAAGRPDPIVGDAGGYRLDVDADDLDLTRFERLVERAAKARTSGRPDDAVALADAAAGLWRGIPFEDLADVPAAASAADRARRLRVDLAVQHGASLLELGRDDEALEALSASYVPSEAAVHREDLTGLVMVAAARLGRRDLAVEAYGRLERDLDQDVGIAPGRDLQQIRAAVLAGDAAALDRAAGALLPADRPATEPATEPLSGGGGHGAGSDARFVGRAAVLGHLEGRLGRGAVVVVVGGPGMGKTALADEVSRRVSASGGAVVRLAGSRVDPGPAPLLASIRRQAGLGRGDPFADLLVPATTDTDPDLQRFRVHQCALEVLRASSPRLVVVDDLQWLDHGAAALLRDLVDGCDEAGWVLLGRPDGRSGAATDLVEDLRSSRPDSVHEVELGPLAPGEVRALVRSRVAETAGGGAIEDPLVEQVVTRSGGWPFLAVELTRHLAGGGTEETIPTSLSRAVDQVARDADAATWETVELLAVVGADLPLAVLGADGTCAADPDGSSLLHTGLVTVVDGRAAISHDLIRDAVLARLTPEARAGLHLRAARALDLDPLSSRAPVARHLLAAGPDGRADLERGIAPALAELRAAAAFDEEADLATGFLEVAGATSVTSDGVRGRIEVGASLLVAGRVDEGLAVLDAVALQARKLGDPVVEASVILARGPVDVGGEHAAEVEDASLELLRRLPASAWRLRIQLGCWVAHHQLVAGRDEQVDELLDGIEEEAADHDDDELRALVLGIRYQATGRCQVAPKVGAEAHDRLRRWALLSGRTSSDAMARLFALDQAGVRGTLADHHVAVERLAEIVAGFPRADVRWYVEAGRAASSLASGDLDRAAEQVAAAGEVGRRFQVGAAAPVERLHQFLLLAGRDQLAVLAPMFQEPLQEGDEPVRIALAGLVGLHAGDVDRAGRAAGLLAAHPRLLGSAGATWPALAHVAGELAFATRSADLGGRLAAELRPRAGTGLSMLGLVLLGSVDRLRGLGLAAAGRPEARSVLEHAVAQDEARGQAIWSDLARRHLASLRGGPPGV